MSFEIDNLIGEDKKKLKEINKGGRPKKTKQNNFRVISYVTEEEGKFFKKWCEDQGLNASVAIRQYVKSLMTNNDVINA